MESSDEDIEYESEKTQHETLSDYSIYGDVQPMLETHPNNLRDINFFKDEGYVSYNNPRRRCKLKLKDGKSGINGFCIKSLLGRNEHSHYISEAERVGFEDVQDLFPEDYRKNDRILVRSEKLANMLWERIEKLMLRGDIINVHPIGFGNGGTWKPYRINECLKFCRYKPGGFFNTHIDGPWVPRQDECSVFTLVVYLNDNFDGGETRFFKTAKRPDEIALQEVCRVQPIAGNAVVFAHDTLHDALAVSEGTKYIIRSEIIFQRVDSDFIPQKERFAYRNSPEYKKMRRLYEASKVSKGREFVDSYLAALKMQQEAQKTESKNTFYLENEDLPRDLWVKCFMFLKFKDLVAMSCLGNEWRRCCADGLLWRRLYLRRWPELVAAEKQYINGTLRSTLKVDPFIKDWHTRYKQRHHIENRFQAVVIDTGTHSVKYGLYTKDGIKTKEMESLVAMEHFRITHVRGGTRYLVGEGARNSQSGGLRAVVSGIPSITKSRILWLGVFSQSIETAEKPSHYDGDWDADYYQTAGYFTGAPIEGVDLVPSLHPVVMVEPSTGTWSQDLKKQIKTIFFDQIRVPALIFVKSSQLVAMYHGCHSGIVVEHSSSAAAVSIVYNDEHIVCQTVEVKEPKVFAQVLKQLLSSPLTFMKMLYNEKFDLENPQVIGDQRTAELRKLLLGNIMVFGGKTLGNGFDEKLKIAMNEMFSSYDIKHADKTSYKFTERIFAAVHGGCTISSLSHFAQLKSLERRINYSEEGKSITHDCGGNETDNIGEFDVYHCTRCGDLVCEKCSSITRYSYHDKRISVRVCDQHIRRKMRRRLAAKFKNVFLAETQTTLGGT